MANPLDLAPAQRLSREIRFRARYGALIARCGYYAATRYGTISDAPDADFIIRVVRRAEASARITPAQVDALTRALDKWESRS